MSISLYSVSTSILKVYNSLQVGLDIESIYGAIYSIYRDIAKVYYSAAKESIMAAEHSIDPASELRIAKSNLVSAYEMAKNLQNMQVKKRILIFFTTTEDVLEYNDYRSYYLNLSKLSAYISLLYRKLNEKESEKRWEEESFTQFNIFLKWMSFDYDERKSGCS